MSTERCTEDLSDKLPFEGWLVLCWIRDEEENRGETEMAERQINVEIYGIRKKKSYFSSRSMVKSCTVAVTKMPPPSLIVLHLKSRSSSSGKAQCGFSCDFSPPKKTFTKPDVGLDQLSDDNSLSCCFTRNKAAQSPKAQGSRTECRDTVHSQIDSVQRGGSSRDIHHIILPQVQ